MSTRRTSVYTRDARNGINYDIQEDDILFKSKYVTILKPDCKKGIVVMTRPENTTEGGSICKDALKTGAQLHKEGIAFKRIIYHPYSFFRAPTRPCIKYDYTTLHSEMRSVYGDYVADAVRDRTHEFVIIRIDPRTTNVFSSEIRAEYRYLLYENNGTQHMENVLNNSRKSVLHYMHVLEKNEQRISKEATPGDNVYYNLFSNEIDRIEKPTTNLWWEEDNNDNDWLIYGEKQPVSKCNDAEVLVDIPILTSNYWVTCIDPKLPASGGGRSNSHNTIMLKSNKKVYTVRYTPQKIKYVTIDQRKVPLSNIRGKYVYTDETLK